MMAAVPDPLLPQPFTVRRLYKETKETYTLELAPTDGARGSPFAAGQYNMLYVFGVGEVPISISGDPMRPQPLVHTVRTVGAVTRAICTLKRGAVLGVRGPFGSAWPMAAAVGKDVVLVRGV
jgi:NAD(P)H-flavin reductase